jgi:hypothetical protein
MTADRVTTRLSFFGRLTDDLTRRMLVPAEMAVSVDEDSRPPLYKDDGHFAFIDLAPSATDYHFRVGGVGYQTRTVAKSLPTTTPVEVTYPGEDELYVSLTAAPNPQHRITFEAVPFVPTIRTGAQVFGQGGFIATLAEALEGQKVTTAVLSASAGLATGQLLRIVRGSSLVLRRAPSATFSNDVTVVAFQVVENVPAEPAIAGATIELTQVNGAGPTAVAVGSLTLRRFTISGTSVLVLDDGGRFTTSDHRGAAVLVLPGDKAVTSVRVAVSRPQFVAAAVTIAVTVKTRNFQKVLLTHV